MACSRHYMSESVLFERNKVPQLARLSKEHSTIEAFREKSFECKKPVVFGKDHGSPTPLLPALDKWFSKGLRNDSATLSEYFYQFRDAMVPYEIYASTPAQKESLALFRDYLEKEQTQDKTMTRSWDSCFAGSTNSQDFFQLNAPLHLFTEVLEFNDIVRKKGSQGISLYIAQCSIADLPQALQEDIPTPEIVVHAGKGDIYGSSIWLGIAPTYTPLHRDPNPNLFCQLSGTKVIRLMAPRAGDQLFRQVQAELQRSGNSRIRTDEMMQGEERDKLHQAVWETDPDRPASPGMYEVMLNPGDAMFIPTHYWHSVKSVGQSGGLNASVNWWFR
ncbi:hypothetical protein FLAG1_01843 [Fusarium langsethiae]|uniref:JmjC domain-containing protein n=1 Tax=Fusarium langsethiae TaxID=179993 RepID=A0A0M9F360_FUSLA|nr:hypothetical protein FLAG1_01843 [Fusarium langsethiae]GKT99895.1 unnamed protein product [Fusarium langsethiae]GKU12207.1 unnamed protein product [Fusarium langsethiae]